MTRNYRGEYMTDRHPDAPPPSKQPDGLTTREIAQRLGIGQHEVQRIIKRAHAKIKRALEAESQ